MLVGNKKTFCSLCDCFVVTKCDHSSAFGETESERLSLSIGNGTLTAKEEAQIKAMVDEMFTEMDVCS